MSETPKAAAAFLEYCELGFNRSLAKLAQKWGKNESYVGQLERWSSNHNWLERVKVYDAEQAKERDKRREAMRQEMDERHALYGKEQAERAIQQIHDLIRAKAFGSQAAVQLFKNATDLERLAMGAATEHIEQSGNAITEWQSIRSTIIQVLAAFPEALIAVAAALAQMGEQP